MSRTPQGHMNVMVKAASSLIVVAPCTDFLGALLSGASLLS